MSARIYAMALVADRRICVDGNVREFRDMTKGVLSISDNGQYGAHGRRCREEGGIDRGEWPRGKFGEGGSGKPDYRNHARSGRVKEYDHYVG